MQQVHVRHGIGYDCWSFEDVDTKRYKCSQSNDDDTNSVREIPWKPAVSFSRRWRAQRGLQHGWQEALEYEASRPGPFGHRRQHKAGGDRGVRLLDTRYARETEDHSS